MEEEVRRARDEVVNMVASRPAGTANGRRALPRALLRRDLGLLVAAGVADLLVAVAVVAVGPDAWFTTAAGIASAVLGANAIAGAFQESRRRGGEVARVREHGADPVDTLAELRADVPPPRWTLVIRVLCELFLLTAVTLVLVSTVGAAARVVVVAALVCHLTATALNDRYSRRRERWKSDFLREEDVVLPPLPDRWRVLVPHRPK
ncbi:hypothetical protein IOD16_13530 [Saccharothrix sp. 6-C]|uniref:hypothetical protein n=1 Tax=Saccharothrix sp. 6-C TaxID=2781735 RepID=UPI00191722B7|nr:hypothetical protein [Saccharothrix sp. 6-C]QQQ79346.1 hypothetical protein IOD16_13530 [Saccharothrix sp. 6-C]